MTTDVLQPEAPPGAVDEIVQPSRNADDLPPFGTISDDIGTHRAAVDYLSRFASESHDSVWAGLIKDAESNARIYEDGYDPKPSDSAVTANDIQGIVISITDIQTREPMTIVIKPVETRSKPQVYWIGPVVTPEIAIVTGLPIGLGGVPVLQAGPMGEMVEALAPAEQYEPLDEWTAFLVKRAAQTGAFPREWVCVMDDRLLADIYQTVFDLMWVESDIDSFVYSNVLMTNIYGFQSAYYGWDSRTQKHIVENFSIREAYLDRSKMEQDKMHAQMFDMVIEVQKAKQLFPEIAPLIDHYATKGQPARVDSNTDWGLQNNRQFQRRTVTLRTAFISDQELPMTEMEAMQHGLVETVEGMLGPEQHLTDAGWQQATGADAASNILPDGSLPDGPWPTTVGIRQLATVNESGRIVQDIRCEHACAPILLNVSIPLPGKPEGQGIPKKLKSMQAADIRLLTALVRYAETFSNPGSMVPDSVAEALKEGLKRTYVDPQETLTAPDHLIERFGENTVMWFRPPPMPDAVPQAMEIMRQKRSESSGRPEVLQGTPPSASSSGRMVEALMAGATSQFSFQAQWTRKMVHRLARLMHYSHLWRLELPDVMKIYSALPEQVMAIAIERARSSKWDIYVDVSNGSAGMADKKLRRAVALNEIRGANGESAMSLTTLREEVGLDAEQESLRHRTEMGPAVMAQPGQESQQENPQPNSNGNGRMH